MRIKDTDQWVSLEEGRVIGRCVAKGEHTTLHKTEVKND